MDEISERKKVNIDSVRCPFCNKADIEVRYISGYISYNLNRIASKSKRTRFVHDPKIDVSSKCPNCGRSRIEIKEALDKGRKVITHEEKIERLKKRGLPLVLGINSK